MLLPVGLIACTPQFPSDGAIHQKVRRRLLLGISRITSYLAIAVFTVCPPQGVLIADAEDDGMHTGGTRHDDQCPEKKMPIVPSACWPEISISDYKAAHVKDELRTTRYAANCRASPQRYLRKPA
jgi:hypothetical protein